jgi:hypothetical protein
MTCRIKTPPPKSERHSASPCLERAGNYPPPPAFKPQRIGSEYTDFAVFLGSGICPPPASGRTDGNLCSAGNYPPSGARVDDPRGVNTCSRAQKSALAVRKKLFGDLPPPLLIELLICGSMMIRFTGNRHPPSRPTMKNFDSETGKGATAGIFG